MALPKVSVIVPVYNAEKYLKECLDSIQRQTLKEIEIICVDDGSTDRSVEILQSFAERDNRFILLSQENAGAGAARNYGFSAANGDFAIFLDSDDLFAPKMLEKLYEKAKGEEADIVACNFVRFFADGKRVDCAGFHIDNLPAEKNVFSYKDCPAYIMSVINPTPWNKLYRSDFIREHSLKFEEISSTNDITFAAVSVATAERIAVVPEYLVQYRVGHSGTISSTKAKNLKNVSIAVSSAIRQAMALPYNEVIKESILRFAVDNYLFALNHYVPDFEAPGVEEFYNHVHGVFASPDFENVQQQTLQNPKSYQSFLTVKAHDYSAMRQMYRKRIIVSLTTYPKRISGIATVLETIYAQTRPADEIVLWLTPEQFPKKEAELPTEIQKLIEEKRLTVRWCADLKPHKKYFYALQEYTEDLVVTIDDDLLYPENMLELLFRSYLQYPNAVSTMRAHLILISDRKKILPYRKWVQETSECLNEPSMQLLATGGAGVLYPPKLFRKEFFDEEAIMENCPWADDLWLKAMQTVSKVPVVLAAPFTRLRYLPGTQAEGLCHSNVEQNQNDVQLEKTIEWMDRIFEKDVFIKNLTSLHIGREILELEEQMPFIRREIIAKTVKDVKAVPTAGLTSLRNRLNYMKTTANSSCFQYYKLWLIFLLAWLPAKFLGFLLCLADNGIFYTLKRILHRMKLDNAARKLYHRMPVFLQSFLRCWKENGILYTIKRMAVRFTALSKPSKSNGKKNKDKATTITLGLSETKHTPELIVSLTSYPARIKTVHKTIETILCQTERPDRVILWLAREQFPLRCWNLPRKLLKLQRHGLRIGWYHDIKSYKKLIPTLKKYPEAIIVTADDDVYYDPDWLEKLYKSYLENPRNIHVHRTTRFYLENGEYRYKAQEKYGCPSYLHKLTGDGGVLYPPHSLHPDVLREDLFTEYARTNDDLWFWFMAVRNNYKILPVERNNPAPKYVEGTQGIESLTKINDSDPKFFDVDLNCLFDHYPEVDGKLRKDYSVVLEYERCSSLNPRRRGQDYYANLQPEQYEANLMDWFRRRSGHWFNSDNPVTFNEKIQWMKLYDATPLKTQLSDKYAARSWVAERIGEKYLIPLLGVWNHFDDIDFDKLPDRFVLKTTHGCGWNLIVPDKAKMDVDEAKQKFDAWMGMNFAYRPALELQYLNITPRIVAEEYLENQKQDLHDYKVFCFDGKADSIMFLSNRKEKLLMAFYDLEWNKLAYTYDHPQNENEVPKPERLKELIMLAETLAKGFSHVRVDFYVLNDGSIKFGEMTFSSASGGCRWNPPEQDVVFGRLIKLPPKSPFPTKKSETFTA